MSKKYSSTLNAFKGVYEAFKGLKDKLQGKDKKTPVCPGTFVLSAGEKVIYTSTTKRDQTNRVNIRKMKSQAKNKRKRRGYTSGKSFHNHE